MATDPWDPPNLHGDNHFRCCTSWLGRPDHTHTYFSFSITITPIHPPLSSTSLFSLSNNPSTLPPFFLFPFQSYHPFFITVLVFNCHKFWLFQIPKNTHSYMKYESLCAMNRIHSRFTQWIFITLLIDSWYTVGASRVGKLSQWH